MAETTKIEIASPLRLNTYRNESNNTQVFQWVTGDYDAENAVRWRSVVSGANAIVVDDLETTTVVEMYFTVTANPSEGNAVLLTENPPALYVGGAEDGACTYGGDLDSYEITSPLFNSNALLIFKNGVKQLKGIDVFFESDNHIRFRDRLQKEDVLTFDYIRG